MHLTLESILELEARISKQRGEGEFQPALTFLDEWLQQAFKGDGDPENLEHLALVAVLASQKAALLLEIASAMLVIGDADGGERVQPALDPQRRKDFAEQALNWFQVAMSACQRALGMTRDNPGSPWNHLVHHQLANIRRGFLQASEGESRATLTMHLPAIRHLFSLLWLGQDLAGAEDLLYLLADLEGRDRLAVTALTFYEELLKLDDARLEAGGLPRAEIVQALPDWRATP
jgi:hypothetical protein